MNLDCWQPLLGQLIDSEIVVDFLSRYPQFKVDRPSDGAQYVFSKLFGIEFLFRPDTGYQGGRTKHLRKLQCVFLYVEDQDGHTQYKGEIPLGFSFANSRNELIAKRTPFRTWKIGDGEVALDHPNPSHDKWKGENVEVSAHYRSSNGKIMYFIVNHCPI